MAKTTTKTNAGKRVPAAAAEEEPESLDQVRDILFGGQMRAVDSRLARLEERFRQDLSNVRRELENRIDTLSAELRSSVKSLEKQLSSLENETGKSDAELRDQLLEQSQTLSERIQQTSRELSAALKREADELRGEKTDLSSMVAVFSNAAKRLADELPESKKKKG